MDKNNELVLVIEQQGLDTSQADSLMRSFAGFYSQARDLVEKCKGISVTDISQKDEMLKAKELRGSLRDIRVEADKTRAKLKENSLREGRAIQGVYNVLEALIKPVEESLERQEKFAENLERERIEKQFVERVNKLSQYVSDVSLYNIKEMADEVFENLLAGCKVSWEKAQEEIKEAENREKQQQALEITRQLRKIEIAPYQDYLNEQKIETVISMGVDEYNFTLNNAKIAKKDYEEKQEKIRLDNIELQKKADDEKKKREEMEEKIRLEKEAQTKKEADEKAIAEAKIKADEEAKVKALLAPDKEKILTFAMELNKIILPAVESQKAKMILDGAMNMINDTIKMLQEEAKRL